MIIKILQDSQMVLREARKHGKAWKVVLIEEGLSKNGKFYPAEVLKKAVHLFDKAKAFFYEWKDGEFNHLPPAIQRMRPEGFPKQIAGWYSDPRYEEIDIEGERKNAITATLNIHEGAKWLKDMLVDAWTNGMRRLLGLSIDADGTTGTKIVSGRPIEVVTSIQKVFGVDLVSHPAAGGQFVRLLASKFKGGEMDREKLIAMIKKLRPQLLEGVNIDEIKDTELQEILEKAMKEAGNVPDKAAEDAKKALAARAKAVGIPEDSSEEDIKKAEDAKAEKDKVAGAAADKETEKVAGDAVTEACKVAEEKGKKENKSQEEIKKMVEEARDEEALKQVIKLIQDEKYPLALSMLQKLVSENSKGDGNSPATEAIKNLMKKVSTMDEKLVIAECGKVLDKVLGESKLPDVVKTKIHKSFSGKKFEEAKLKESIEEETEILSKLTNDGEVELEGMPDITVGRSGTDRLQAAADLMLEPTIDDNEKDRFEGINAFKSLREAYVKVTGDTDISGRIPQKRLQEATSSDFSYILGTSIYRKMAKAYKLTPAMWKDLADVISVKDFKTQEVIRWGGFANLEAVTESDTADTYPAIAFPTDEEATYSASTRGGIVTITRTMIINDDLRSLQKIPTKIARAAVRTLNQFVFDLLLNYSSATINGGTIYDSLALYHANHFNLDTAALDYDSYGDAIDRLREQKETGYQADLADNPLNSSDTDFDLDSNAIAANYNVGDYILMDAEFMGPVTVVSTTNVTVSARGIWGSTAASHVTDTAVKIVTDDLALEPEFLWVPTDLRTTGEAILKSEFIDDTLSNRNPYKGSAKLMVTPRRYLRGDTDNWFVTAAKKDIELIEIGFLGGKQVPELLRQDAPGVGLVFTRDNIRYKVRHEYGGAVIDYRGFQGAIV